MNPPRAPQATDAGRVNLRPSRRALVFDRFASSGRGGCSDPAWQLCSKAPTLELKRERWPTQRSVTAVAAN